MMKNLKFLWIFFLTVNAVTAVTIKTGVMESTPVSLVSEWHIDKGTQVGEHFSARVVEDLISPSGEIVIPKNSRVVGRIAHVLDERSFHRDAQVDIQFEKIVLPDNVQSIKINADGTLTKDKYKGLKIAAEATKKTAIGAAMGAFASVRFGGIVASSGSYGSNLMIGAATGGALSLVSFMAQPGKPVEVYPGLPMTLNIISMEEQDYKSLPLTLPATGVEAEIKKFKNDTLSVVIKNDKDHPIPLSNLKIVDGLGYTVHPIIGFKYFDEKAIPAHSEKDYKIKFPLRAKKVKQWLVLTDSFNKQEYFRVEL